MSVQEIIKGCINNDEKYQRLLVVNYSSMLLTVSRRYTPISADAEDVLQDAFIKIFGAIKQFDSNRGALESWMRTIVINTALKRLNKKCFTHEQTVEQFNEIQLHPTVYGHLEAEDIMALINTLPDGYRQVFNLAVVEGYPHKEIAALLNIEEATSRSNLSKAKKLTTDKIKQSEKARVMGEDRLDKFIKKQVEQHKTLNDPDLLWQKIQAKQNAKKKPRRRFLIFWLLGGVFLLGSLAFLYTSQFSNTDSYQHEGALNTNENQIDTNLSVEKATDNESDLINSIDKKETTDLIASTTNISATNQPTKNDFAIANQPTDSSLISGSNKKISPISTKPSKRVEVPVLGKDTPIPFNASAPNAKTAGADRHEEKPENSVRNNLTNSKVFKNSALLPIPTMNLALDEREIDSAFIEQQKEKTGLLQYENKHKGKERQWSLSNGAAFTFGKALRSLSNQDSVPYGYLQTRNDMETALYAVRLNLDFMVQHNSGFYLKSGLEYQQINERFDSYIEWNSIETDPNLLLAIIYNMDGTSSEIRGSGEVLTTNWIRKKRYNRYRSIDIPLLIGYNSTKKDKILGWFVEGGASMNLWFNATGEILDPADQPLRLEDNANLFKAQTGISVIGAAGLTYQVADKFSIWASPEIKYNLSPITSDENILDQKYLNVGLSVGIRYHWLR